MHVGVRETSWAVEEGVPNQCSRGVALGDSAPSLGLRFLISPITSKLVGWFSVAAITNRYSLGLKQQKRILTQSWRPEI